MPFGYGTSQLFGLSRLFHAPSHPLSSAKGPDVVPIQSLPVELLTEVFMLLCQKQYQEGSRAYLEALLLITSTCRLWREIGTSTPMLWRAIHTSDPHPHGAQNRRPLPLERLAGRLEAFLTRSSPLSIFIEFHFEGTRTIEQSITLWRVLAPQIHRCEVLALKGIPRDLAGAIFPLEGFFPYLRSLHVSCKRLWRRNISDEYLIDVPIMNSQAFPSLRNIDFSCIYLWNFRVEGISSLKLWCQDLIMPLSEIRNLLESCQRLEDLWISVSLLYDIMDVSSVLSLSSVHSLEVHRAHELFQMFSFPNAKRITLTDRQSLQICSPGRCEHLILGSIEFSDIQKHNLLPLSSQTVEELELRSCSSTSHLLNFFLDELYGSDTALLSSVRRLRLIACDWLDPDRIDLLPILQNLVDVCPDLVIYCDRWSLGMGIGSDNEAIPIVWDDIVKEYYDRIVEIN
ncbi:hypothetical protein DL93DRAFT_2085623 [Clavulina sp. PMI_390]|nr:hypothetical protein DL93DRAFT_2085623 [Clavulina sp. PMI_390]